jgi:hypothetical protein
MGESALEHAVQKIEIQYTCNGCGVRNRPMMVRARDKKHDVLFWMSIVRTLVCDDHRMLSPLCRAQTFDLRVPMQTDVVGEVLKH